MKFKLAISPCPNDTFIFDALLHKKIDTEGLELETVLEDIQRLNERALRNEIDFIKVSAGVIPLIWDNYTILPSGGAMGYGVGPLLITRPELQDTVPAGNDRVIALPGINTTAHFLFNMAYPSAVNKKFMLFSSIEEDVMRGRADYGVIIHENRFTYLQKGLCLVKDLGKFWEEHTGLPIPLGVIAAKKSVPLQTVQMMHRLIQKSYDHARAASYIDLPEFVCRHAQEMSLQVMREHIDLYVNSFSREIGIQGRNAIVEMLKLQAAAHNRPPNMPSDLFVP